MAPSRSFFYSLILSKLSVRFRFFAASSLLHYKHCTEMNLSQARRVRLENYPQENAPGILTKEKTNSIQVFLYVLSVSYCSLILV